MTHFFLSFVFSSFLFSEKGDRASSVLVNIGFLVPLTWPIDGPRNFLHRLFCFSAVSFLLVGWRNFYPRRHAMARKLVGILITEVRCCWQSAIRWLVIEDSSINTTSG